MEKYENEKGVWRTVRGRRIFIRSGESLGSAMARSGKFNDNGKLPRREDYHKAKKQIAMEEANEKENKAFDYVYKKPKDEKQKEQWKKKADKATENRIKKTKEYNDFMDLYDKDRDDNELTWQDRAEKIHRQGEKIREKKSPRDDDYYETYRNEEEQFSKIKQEPDDAPYESLPAYKTYHEKMMKLEKENKSWTGKEYTNDEFMEHLTDANWHAERRMIEEAGLTNKQLRELKNQVKLSSWSAGLDKKSTQELIDKVKKEFPAKDTKKTIEDYVAKKQSNNKIDNDNKTITELNNEMLGDKYKGKGLTPSLIYSNDRRIEIANNIEGGKTATIWKDGKIERKTRLPENVKGDKTKQYFDDYLGKLDKDNLRQSNNKIDNDVAKKFNNLQGVENSNKNVKNTKDLLKELYGEKKEPRKDKTHRELENLRGEIQQQIKDLESKQSNNKIDPYDDPESNESQRLQSIQSRYDEYLQDTEGRGASYGEIAYVDSLRGKELDDFEKELDDYETKKYNKQETIKNYVEKKQSNNGKLLSYDYEQKTKLVKEINKQQKLINSYKYRGVIDGRTAVGKRATLRNEEKYAKEIKEHQKKIEELEKKMKQL